MRIGLQFVVFFVVRGIRNCGHAVPVRRPRESVMLASLRMGKRSVWT
jgi:hypothetical protein